MISFLLDELEIVYVKNDDVIEIPTAVENFRDTENFEDQPQIITINNIKTETNQEFIVSEESNDVVTNDNAEEEDLTFEDQVEIKEDPLEQEYPNDQSNNKEIDTVLCNPDEHVEIDQSQQIRNSNLRKRKGNQDENSVDIPIPTKRNRRRNSKRLENKIEDEEKIQSKTQRSQANRKYIFILSLILL